MERNGDDGIRISVDLIKLVTGQFDVGSVLSLPLVGLGISEIENFDELTSLKMLDLSNNKITRISGFEPIGRCLIRLDLRFNNISRLEGLQALQVLEVVKLQGNVVKDVDTVLSLAGLAKLRAIHLQDVDGRYANPVCKEPRYRDQVVKKFPRLGNLDGEFFLSEDCRPKVIGDGECDDIVIPPQKRWVPKNYFSTDCLLDSYVSPLCVGGWLSGSLHFGYGSARNSWLGVSATKLVSQRKGCTNVNQNLYCSWPPPQVLFSDPD